MPISKIDHERIGFYRHTTIRAVPFDDGSTDFESMRAVFEQEFTTTIEDVIVELEKAAASVLSQYTAEVEVGGTPANPIMERRRSDKVPWELPKSFPAHVKPHEERQAFDARRVMFAINDLKRAIHIGIVPQAALVAYRLGQLAGMMGVRPFEPIAERTIKREAKREKAHHEIVVEPAEQQAEQFIREMNSIIEKQTASGKKRKVTAAVHEAVDRLGISRSSGWNYYKKNRSKVL